jgi:two-component sensor histidine kinase
MKRAFRLRLTGANGSSVARRLVKRALGVWHLEHQVDDALIVATELVENVAKHTSNGGELQLCVRHGALVIQVSDSSSQLPQVRSEDFRSPHGRGMRMVQVIADRWGARPTASGKIVWAELDTAA